MNTSGSERLGIVTVARCDGLKRLNRVHASTACDVVTCIGIAISELAKLRQRIEQAQLLGGKPKLLLEELTGKSK
jgi:hypothetical protein